LVSAGAHRELMTNEIPRITLNNGVEMPILGFGVLDTGGTLFFDHADPEMVSLLNSRRVG
jgi:hypothetical protein